MWHQLILISTIIGCIIANPFDLIQRHGMKALPPRDQSLNYRLPKSVSPTSYQVWLQVDIDNLVFNGTEIITIDVLERTTNISLNYKDLSGDWLNAKLRNGDTTWTPVDVDLDENTEILTLIFNEDIPLAELELQLEFAGTIRNDVIGLYSFSYEIENKTRTAAVTQFQATFARMVFPCFDEPGFKAKFNFHFYHQLDLNVLFNTPLMSFVGPIDELGGLCLTTFEETPPMSTYLLAFLISNYEERRAQTGTVGIYTPPDEIDLASYTLRVIGESLDHLASWLGHPFQLRKIDFASIPRLYFGAMENWGLVTMRSSLFSYDTSVTPAATHQSTATIISHELTHMWFGNEVTPEWWSYLWLNEGFATFFEFYITAMIEPNWRLMDQFLVKVVHRALTQDDKEDARAMTAIDVQSPSDINNYFDYVPYEKSGSVIRMFQHVLGMDVFKNALHNYLAERSFNTTNPDHLFDSLQKEIDNTDLVNLPNNAKIKEVFESWSNTPGYPVVKLTRNNDRTAIILTQKQFLTMPNNEETPSQFYIPINLATVTNKNFLDTTPSVWLTPTTESLLISFNAPDDWIILNKQQTGYFRVNYDDDDWKLISNHLRGNDFDEIHLLSRAQLLDDVANLAKADETEFKNAFDLYSYLSQEMDYIPWSSAYNSITMWLRMLRNIAEYEKLEYFIRTLTENVYKGIRFIDFNYDHIRRLHTISTGSLACLSGNELCVDDMQTLVQDIIDAKNTVREEHVELVFCTLSKHLSEENSDTSFLISYVMELLQDREKNIGSLYKIINGLGCTTNENNVNRLLEMTTSTLIEQVLGIQMAKYDRNVIFKAVVTGSYVGTKLGMQLIFDKYITLETRYESMFEVFSGLGTYIVSDELDELMDKIIQTYSGRMSANVLNLARAEAEIGKKNIAWINSHKADINKWLSDNIVIPQKGGSRNSLTANSILCVIITMFYCFAE